MVQLLLEVALYSVRALRPPPFKRACAPDCLTGRFLANADKLQHIVSLSWSYDASCAFLVPHGCRICLDLKIERVTEFPHIHLCVTTLKSILIKGLNTNTLLPTKELASLLPCVLAFGASIQQCRNCSRYSIDFRMPIIFHCQLTWPLVCIAYPSKLRLFFDHKAPQACQLLANESSSKEGALLLY